MHKSPGLLVLDDPFAGLDVDARANLQDALARLAAEGLPMILMVRRADEIPSFATHMLVLKDMRIARRRRLHKKNAKKKPRHFPLSLQAANAAPSGQPIIEMRDVTVRYGRRVVLDRLNWTVRRGERWLLTGPNGSGKTTLLSLITGDNPTAYAHDIRVFGHARGPGQSIWSVRRRIGHVSTEIQCHFDIAVGGRQPRLPVPAG